MRPRNKLFLFALIIFLLFGTVSVVQALDKNVTCDESPQSGLIDSGNTEDTYTIWLDVGQKLIIDVDAEKIGSTLDSYLVVSNSNGDEIGVSDKSTDVAPGAPTNVSEDPYLEITADVDDTYTLTISAAGNGTSAADEGSYTLLFKCSVPGQPTPPEFTWPVLVGDLIGSTDSNPGSIINITPENAESSLPFPLGVGPIADIEFDPTNDLVFVAVDAAVAIDDVFAVDAAVAVEDIPAKIVALDRYSGNEVASYSLKTESVVALEAAENELYGVRVDPDTEAYSLVLVTFDESDPTDPTTTLTPVFSFDRQQVWALAYHSVEKAIYGVASIVSASDLIKIHLEPELSVDTTSAIPILDEMGLPVNVVSLDFSNDNILFGVDLSGNRHEINQITGQAVPIGVPIAGVSSLTSVVGVPQDVDPVKTICSSTLTTSASASSETSAPKLSRFKRKRNPLHRAIGLFKFEGLEGETVTLNVELEGEESAEAVVEESSASELKNSWLNHWKGKGRVFLGIRDSIPDLDFRKRKKEQIPFSMSATLPADGTYYVMLIRPLLRYYKTDYCITLDSDYKEESQAWKTFDVAWPKDKSEDDTTPTSAAESADVQNDTETVAGASSDDSPVPVVALSTTAVNEPAADGGDPEVGQTLAETPVVEPVAEVPVVTTEPIAEIPMVTTEPVAEIPVVTTEPVAEIPVVTTEPIEEIPVVTTEPVAEIPVVTTEPIAEIPVVTTEPVAEVPVVTTEPIEEVPPAVNPRDPEPADEDDSEDTQSDDGGGDTSEVDEEESTETSTP
jgi:hypothetical protein